MSKTKKTVRTYLKEEWSSNGGHITKKAILDNCFDRIGSYLTYADIEGKYMAVYSYWEHNVENFDQVENDKYVGYEITCDLDRTNWLIKKLDEILKYNELTKSINNFNDSINSDNNINDDFKNLFI